MERSDFTMWTGSTEQFVADDSPATDDEDRRVQAWRAEQLRELGLPARRAEVRAARDWHEVAALVARGCAPEVALEIAL
jgi:hypothetical protein